MFYALTPGVVGLVDVHLLDGAAEGLRSIFAGWVWAPDRVVEYKDFGGAGAVKVDGSANLILKSERE